MIPREVEAGDRERLDIVGRGGETTRGGASAVGFERWGDVLLRIVVIWSFLHLFRSVVDEEEEDAMRSVDDLLPLTFFAIFGKDGEQREDDALAEFSPSVTHPIITLIE